jgi:hypothetical protein
VVHRKKRLRRAAGRQPSVSIVTATGIHIPEIRRLQDIT